MEIRFANGALFGARCLVTLLGFLVQFLRVVSSFARPGPAFKLLGASATVALLAMLPARALISPTAAVGATPGSFTVSPSGAATYVIPIVVAPGTNEMEPDLSFVYTSHEGNGFLGVGWALAGFSVVHRCGATIEIDGFKGGVNYDVNDRFCLDGERLIAIGANEYRTHQESLQKIIVVGGTATSPPSFTVTDKTGSVREYAGAIEAAGGLGSICP